MGAGSLRIDRGAHRGDPRPVLRHLAGTGSVAAAGGGALGGFASRGRVRSLWIAADASPDLPLEPGLFGAGPLLRALIVEAAELQGAADQDGYRGRVTGLIIDQLRRVTPIPIALPWPQTEPLTKLCTALYENPSDERSAEDWSRELGMSPRTLSRRFEAEVGLTLRSWRRRLRLFKAIEMLGGGMDVTRTAMELGYGSSSAFTYAFRMGLGLSPKAYMRATLG